MKRLKRKTRPERARLLQTRKIKPPEKVRPLRTRKISTKWLFVRELLYYVGGFVAIALVPLVARYYFVTRRYEIAADSLLLSIGATSVSVGSLLVTALLSLMERTVRRNSVMYLLKAKHKHFFETVSEDVARLIEKSQKDARSLPGSAE